MKPVTSPPPLRRSWQARLLAWGFCISLLLLHVASWGTALWFLKKEPLLLAFPTGVFVLSLFAVIGGMMVVSFRGFAFSPLGPYLPQPVPHIGPSATAFTSYARVLNARVNSADWYLTEEGILIRLEWGLLQLFIPWDQVSHVSKTLGWTEKWELHHEAPDVTSPLGGNAQVMQAICQQLEANRKKDVGRQQAYSSSSGMKCETTPHAAPRRNFGVPRSALRKICWRHFFECR